LACVAIVPWRSSEARDKVCPKVASIAFSNRTAISELPPAAKKSSWMHG
jgi:hypothetical protein